MNDFIWEEKELYNKAVKRKQGVERRRGACTDKAQHNSNLPPSRPQRQGKGDGPWRASLHYGVVISFLFFIERGNKILYFTTP